MMDYNLVDEKMIGPPAMKGSSRTKYLDRRKHATAEATAQLKGLKKYERGTRNVHDGTSEISKDQETKGRRLFPPKDMSSSMNLLPQLVMSGRRAVGLMQGDMVSKVGSLTSRESGASS